MSHRKYLGLLALIVVLLVTMLVPVSFVGATVHTPPTPIPTHRFSESSDNLIAMARRPGDIVVLGESGGGSEFVKAAGITDADMDQAIVARLDRAHTGASYEGGRKVLAKYLPRAATVKELLALLRANGVYLSEDFIGRVERTGESREILFDILESTINPDKVEFTYVESDNTWFMGCKENGDCYQ